jgi:hypothetical protein
MAKVEEGGKVMIKPSIHPATPSRLKTEFRRARYNFRTLAKALGVNVYYVHRLIRYGEEPANENIRRMLYLPKHPRLSALPTPQAGATQAGEPLPDYEKWWRYTLKKANRIRIKQRLYQHAKDIDNSPSG